MLLLTALAVTLVWAFRNWLNRPRFQSLRLGGLAINGCGMCALTLLEFNLHQYKSALGTSSGIFPTGVIIFNVAAVLVYAAFIGIYAWKLEPEFRPPSPIGERP